jgi:tetratricopeptide (TPR) repeat protein
MIRLIGIINLNTNFSMKKVFLILILANFQLSVFNSFGQDEDYLKKIFPVADEHLKNGKIDLALKNFLELEKLYPDNAHVKYKIGMCYFTTTNRKSLAIPYFRAASKIFQKNIPKATINSNKPRPMPFINLPEPITLSLKLTVQLHNIKIQTISS